MENLDFYEKNPTNTTIVVVADHETGGLALGRSKTKYEFHPAQLMNQKISMYELNNVIKKWRDEKPSFAKVMRTLKSYFSLDNWSEDVMARLQKAYDFTFDPKLKDQAPQKFMYSTSEPIAIAMIDIVAERTGVAWTTVGHTGMPIPVSAIGQGQQLFGGMTENTAVFKNLKSIIEKK